jgi:polar amino acid transport system substrate-binding protein
MKKAVMLLKRVAPIILCLMVFLPDAFGETRLIIATGENPPYISQDPQASCLSEVFNAVAKEMGVTFDFQFMPWKRCERSVEELKVWAAIPYLSTSEREEKFLFSDKLYARQAKFFYYSAGGKKKNIVYSGLKDLRGYKIGGVSGYYYEKQFFNSGIELELVTTEEQDFKKLKSERIDFALAEENIGWHLIRKLFPKEQLGNFFTLETPYNISDIFLITSKQYPDTQRLLTSFNNALKKIKQEGLFQKILDKHKITVLAY